MDKEELNENLQQIWNLLREVDTKVSTHIAEEAQWKPNMLTLVETWTQAKGVLNFLKWAAAVSASITAFWTWLSQHITLK